MKNKFLLFLTALSVCLVILPGAARATEKTEYMTFLNDQTSMNDRIGRSFTIDVPDIFNSIRIPGGGESLEFTSKDGEYILMVCHSFVTGNEDADADNFRIQKDTKALLAEIPNRILGELIPGTDKSGENFYAYSELTDGPREGAAYVQHEYGIRDPKTKAVFFYILVYPKSEEKRFKEITDHMDKSFILGDEM